MHLKISIIEKSTRNLIVFLNFLINPNSFLLEKRQENTGIPKDIRSSSKLRIAGKKFIYFFRTIFLIIADNITIVVSWICATQLNKIINEGNFIFFNELKSNGHSYLLLMLVVINLSIFISSGLYSTSDRSRRIRDALSAFSVAYITFILTTVIIYNAIFTFDFLLILNLTTIWLSTLFLISAERFLVFQGIQYVRNKITSLKRKVILIGEDKDIDNCKKLFIESKNFYIIETLGVSSLNSSNFLEVILGRCSYKGVDEIIICSWEKIEQPIKMFWALQTSGISWRIIPIKQSIPQHNHELADIEGVPSIRYSTSTIVGINFLLKRIFDLVMSSWLLIIFSIPMLFIGLLIKLDSPGSVFYQQTRVGLTEKKFKVWKFRTMVQNASEIQKELENKNEISGGILFKISDDPRITKIGKYLRRYSLDEFPQLFNVLRGEMSLVGPRPLPIRDVEKFESHHHFRHEVLPGITGLWQVSGRSDTSSEQVFKLDFHYIENWSLAIDFKIILKTLWVVLFKQGAY